MRWTRRDAIAGVVIVFLLGLLAGQWMGDRQHEALAQTPPAVAPATGTVADLKTVSQAMARVAEQVTPAVVNINSTRIIRGQTYYDPFRELWGGSGLFKQPDRRSESLGSGVIVDPSGVVVTNNHNIADADEVRVSLSDSREFKATVVGRDPLSDVAVLRIEGANLPAAQWGDSQRLRVGEWVLAIGNPFGFNQTVTSGIVSAKGRHDIGVSDFEEFIQTDAAINPGNSGGALVDINGKLVGINTAIFSKTGGYQGIGFAIPAHIAKPNAEQLLSQGRIIRGWIGVIAGPLNSNTARQLRLNSTKGAVIVNLWQDQPAIRSGVVQYDVVTAVNGKPVDSPRDLRLAVAEAPVGSTLKLSLMRGGRPVEVSLKVSEHPSQGGEPLAGI